MSRFRTRLPWLLTALIVLVIGGSVLLLSDERQEAAIGSAGAGETLGGDFTLQSSKGPVSLEDFRGQVVLLYFGFVNCPGVCPASMAVYRRALEQLTAAEREQVQPLLVTIDPERDSLAEIDAFVDYFNSNIIGLSGELADIKTVAAQYGAFFEKADAEDSELAYVFDHVSRYYVIDQNGVLVDAMRHSTTANELRARIRSLL